MNGAQKDPVCGMTVLPERGLTTLYNGQTISFCSEYCRNKFLAQSERYLSTFFAPSQENVNGARRVAYFSMEVAVGSSMPTYSGGLGVLAGDALKSCADLRVSRCRVITALSQRLLRPEIRSRGRAAGVAGFLSLRC